MPSVALLLQKEGTRPRIKPTSFICTRGLALLCQSCSSNAAPSAPGQSSYTMLSASNICWFQVSSQRALIPQWKSSFPSLFLCLLHLTGWPCLLSSSAPICKYLYLMIKFIINFPIDWGERILKEAVISITYWFQYPALGQHSESSINTTEWIHKHKLKGGNHAENIIPSTGKPHTPRSEATTHDLPHVKCVRFFTQRADRMNTFPTYLTEGRAQTVKQKVKYPMKYFLSM